MSYALPLMNSDRKSATNFLVRLGQMERAISFAAFMVMIAVVFIDVVSRELTGGGMHWAGQAGVYANLFVVMFGLGVASANGSHLRPRFADCWLPDSWEPVLIRLQELLMALFCAAFAVIAATVVADSIQLAERSAVLGILVWPFQVVIPAAFGLAAVRHGLYALYPELRPADTDHCDQHPLCSDEQPGSS